MFFRQKKRVGRATRMIALSFGGVILVGTLLLCLPIASVGGTSCGLLTALFTATSATCVTGLVLADTLTGWTLFGQAVILVMIQLGGLGFMTVIFCLGMLLRRRSSLNQRLMMMSSFNLSSMDDVSRVVRHALRFTFILEGAGAAVLTLCFLPQYGWGAVWKGIFTSISAFCNAGFDLMGPEGAGSLSSYNGHPLVLLTVMALVTAGGLGFFVWEEIRGKRAFKTLSLYSKMVIVISGGLILSGAVFFFCAEFQNPATFGEMPVWKRALNALFQSVTLRTAGFAAVDQGSLTDISMIMSILFMLIGGSSGSTAGGLKTVTVGVLLLSLRAGLQGRDEVVVRGRTIPQRKVLSALTLVLVVGGLFLFSSMALAVLSGLPFLQCAFEAASAIGTVGLSTGITTALSPLSRLLVILLMYLGRVGVLSFSIAFLTHGGGNNKVRYPDTNVMIG